MVAHPSASEVGPTSSTKPREIQTPAAGDSYSPGLRLCNVDSISSLDPPSVVKSSTKKTGTASSGVMVLWEKSNSKPSKNLKPSKSIQPQLWKSNKNQRFSRKITAGAHSQFHPFHLVISSLSYLWVAGSFIRGGVFGFEFFCWNAFDLDFLCEECSKLMHFRLLGNPFFLV